MVSGSEILNYQGNPNLGGFAGDGSPMLGSDRDHYGEINQILRDTQKQDSQRQAIQYEQAVKDRDAAALLLSQQDMALPLEKQDQQVVKDKYNKIKDVFLKYNGNPKAHPKGWQEALGAMAEFKQYRTLAQLRNTEATKQRLAIAQENDPDDRKRMQEQLKSQLDQGIQKVPDPYLKPFSYKVDDWIKDPGMKEVVLPPEERFFRDKEGKAFERSRKVSNIDGIFDYYSPQNLMEGPNKSLPNAISQGYADLTHQPEMDDDKYLAINTALDALNKKNGWLPGTPRYQTPIAIKDPGTGKMVPITDATDFARKMALYRYGNIDQTTTELSKAAQNAFEDAAKTRNINAETKQHLASANEQNSLAGLHSEQAKTERDSRKVVIDKIAAEAEKAHIDGDINQQKFLANQQKFVGTATDAQKAYSEITNAKDYKSATTYPKGIQDIITNGIGGDLATTQISKVQMTPALRRMGSVQAIDIDKKPTRMSVSPNAIYSLKGPDGKSIGLAVIGTGETARYKTFDLNTGAIDYMRTNSGWPTDASENDNEAALSAVLNKMNAATTSSTTTPVHSENDIRKNENGSLEVRVDGIWKKAIGKDKNGNPIFE